MNTLPDILPKHQSHILLIGAPQTGQRYLAIELAKAAFGRVLVLDETPSLSSLLKQEPSLPSVVVRDFSTRLLPLASNDPWLSLARALLEQRLALIVLTVAHSGPSGRELPPAELFDEVWTVKEGFQYANPAILRARENHEITLSRPNNNKQLYFRSQPNSTRYDQIENEELANV